MSLILEALKKSERERRLGESPSLGSPIMHVRRRRSLMPPLVALIAIGLGAYWWLNREPSAPVETAATQVAAPTTATPFEGTQPATANPVAGSEKASVAQEPVHSTAADRLPHSRVPADATTGLRPDLRERVKSGELVVANPQLLKPGESATIKESEAMAPSADAPPMPAGSPDRATGAVATADPADNAKRAETVDAATRPATAAPNATAKSAAIPTTPPPAAAPVAAPPAPATAPDASGPPVALIWELPYAKRSQLPELKLTMHVFAAVPAQRFVIINGSRQVEGDDIEGLRVVEIRPDGVVFDHQGQRFLYPRGGR